MADMNFFNLSEARTRRGQAATAQAVGRQQEMMTDQMATDMERQNAYDNSRLLAGASKVLLEVADDPRRFDAAKGELGDMLIERGLIDANEWNPEAVTPEYVQTVYDMAMMDVRGYQDQGLGGQNPIAKLAVADAYIGATEENRRLMREAWRNSPAKKLVELKLPDGSVVQANYDPETGIAMSLDGKTIYSAGINQTGNLLDAQQVGSMTPGMGEVTTEFAGQPVGVGQSPEAKKRAEETVKREMSEDKLRDAMITQVETGYRLMPLIQQAQGDVSAWTAGIGSYLAAIPGTGARDLQATLTTIKGNIGFDRLQRMRAESPTGGALGQVAVQELEALQSTIASLDQAQSVPQLKSMMQIVFQQYASWMDAFGEAIMREGDDEQKARYYDVIPSGAIFTHPDGSKRIKP